MKLKDAPREPWASGLLRQAEDAIVDLIENAADDYGLDLDELYQVDVVLNAPIVARFTSDHNEYEFVWNGNEWVRVTQ